MENDCGTALFSEEDVVFLEQENDGNDLTAAVRVMIGRFLGGGIQPPAIVEENEEGFLPTVSQDRIPDDDDLCVHQWTSLLIRSRSWVTEMATTKSGSDEAASAALSSVSIE